MAGMEVLHRASNKIQQWTCSTIRQSMCWRWLTNHGTQWKNPNYPTNHRCLIHPITSSSPLSQPTGCERGELEVVTWQSAIVENNTPRTVGFALQAVPAPEFSHKDMPLAISTPPPSPPKSRSPKISSQVAIFQTKIFLYFEMRVLWCYCLLLDNSKTPPCDVSILYYSTGPISIYTA